MASLLRICSYGKAFSRPRMKAIKAKTLFFLKERTVEYTRFSAIGFPILWPHFTGALYRARFNHCLHA